MKKVFFALLLLLITKSYGQSSPWSYGVQYSIQDVSLSNDDFGYIVTGNSTDGYGADFDLNNYSLGFVMNYEFNKKISFSSGLLYVNKDFTGSFICPACGFIDLAPETIKQRFLSIPLTAQYQLTKGKFRPIVEGGFQNNFNVQTDIAQANRAYFLEFLIGGALTYQLGDSFSAGIGYRYTTGITDVYKQSDLKFNTHNYFIQLIYQP